MKNDKNSTEEMLVESHALLREAMDYLTRLPPNPLTAQMARKISNHLENPLRVIETRRAGQVAKVVEQTALRNAVGVHGTGWFLPSGVPALELMVVGSLATISSPAAASYRSTSAGKSFALGLASKLSGKVEIELHAKNRSQL